MTGVHRYRVLLVCSTGSGARSLNTSGSNPGDSENATRIIIVIRIGSVVRVLWPLLNLQ